MLERHCEAVDRDRGEIVITYKSVMIVAASEATAKEAWDAYRAPRGLPPTAPALVGTAEQVARQVAAFLEAGVDEVIVEVPSAHDPDAIRDAGKALEMAVQSAHVTL